MCWYGHSLFLCLLVFFSWSRTPIDDQFLPTRPTGKHLSIPTLLFSFERSDWMLPFLCSLLFLVCSCFYFRALLYVLWCITHLTSMLVRKNAFTPRNVCMHKWVFVGTHEHMCVLRSTRDERCDFFFFFFFFCYSFFYFGYYVMRLLFGYVTTYASFYGAYVLKTMSRM